MKEEVNGVLVSSLLYIAAKQALSVIESGLVKENHLIEEDTIRVLRQAIAVADQWKQRDVREVLVTAKTSDDVIDEDGNICNEL